MPTEYILMELNGMKYRLHPDIVPLVDRAGYIRTHFNKLTGSGISMSEAARRYNLTQPSISNMVRRNQVRLVGRDPRDSRVMLVDEADIAYCAAVRRIMGGQGRKLFNKDGSLYIPPKYRVH